VWGEGEETEETDLVHAACEEGDNGKGVRMADEINDG